ncbi:unnamed protein product [Rotaria magnacalcarata]|uniref:Uncharacterized protein n=1 Tax=Rotaria magnacalcarata TaxID=392030 RepID=A0A818YUP6_9BILA|nr:unnamed protein product [Rotaria magnacalcarata]
MRTLPDSLAEYKTNELTLVHLKNDPDYIKNQLQSFDRLYRVRSESQPLRESVQEIENQQQALTNSKQRPASVQLNPTGSLTQGQNVTSLPARSTRPITSHTSLHAYWNDPNFDTQSQTSNSSSMTKKRRAPMPPGYVSPPLQEQQNMVLHSPDHHQSHESLTESINGTKQKRKAPVVPIATIPQETQTDEIVDHQQLQANNVEQQKINIKMSPSDEQRLLNLLAEQQAPITTTLLVTTQAPQENLNETHSTTPIYSQIQKVPKEVVQTESSYSTVQPPPTTPVREHEEIRSTSPTNYSVGEIVQAGIAEPPLVSPRTTSKESSPVEGLLKIVKDHNERAEIYQKNEKQPENVSYFRVAKSRYGKFETDSQGFVNNSNDVFAATDNNQEQQQPKTVTVESDRKQIITRASPVPQQPSTSPSILAPKPFGKTVTEYRTVRRIGNDGETTTTTTVHTQTIPSTTNDSKESASNINNADQTNSNSTTQQESAINASRQNDGSENLTKN